MKRVINATTDGASLKSKLAGYEDEIYIAIQDQFPGLSIQPENIVIDELHIHLQDLSIQELMMNVMSEEDWSHTWYVKDTPNLQCQDLENPLLD